METVHGTSRRKHPCHSRVRKGRRQSILLFFIDPTGWSGFALKRITPLLQQDPGEVLINFMTVHIKRFIDAPAEQERGDFEQLFGSADFREELASSRTCRTEKTCCCASICERCSLRANSNSRAHRRSCTHYANKPTTIWSTTLAVRRASTFSRGPTRRPWRPWRRCVPRRSRRLGSRAPAIWSCSARSR